MAWHEIEAAGLCNPDDYERFEVLYLCWLTGWTPEMVQGMGVREMQMAMRVYEKLRTVTGR